MDFPWPTEKFFPYRFFRDNTDSDERDQVHNRYDDCGDGEDPEERPEISGCWRLSAVCLTNARCIFVKVVEERGRFSHFVIKDL